MVTTPRLTYQDYANLEGDERYELLDGELILVGSPNTDHQTASMKMGYRMFSFVEENDLGWFFHAPFDVLFTDTDVVQPDLLFISKDREHIITPANIQGAPDLIVEILSPSSVQTRLARQARAIRQPRRERVLDRRPRPWDGMGNAS